MDSLDCQLLQRLFSKERAVRIKEGTLSAFDIAQEVGFDDESHLRRRFKQYFGISMKEYRLVNHDSSYFLMYCTRRK